MSWGCVDLNSTVLKCDLTTLWSNVFLAPWGPSSYYQEGRVLMKIESIRTLQVIDSKLAIVICRAPSKVESDCILKYELESMFHILFDEDLTVHEITIWKFSDWFKDDFKHVSEHFWKPYELLQLNIMVLKCPTISLFDVSGAISYLFLSGGFLEAFCEEISSFCQQSCFW